MKHLLVLAVLLVFAAELHAASLTITPNGSSASLVTAGIPFAACALTDAANFKLLNEKGGEVPIFIKPTLYWPDSKCDGAITIRAVKIQFAYDPEQGKAIYDWQLSPRTLPDMPEAPVAEVAAKNPAREGYMEPAFFAINDPAYLVTTGLISPTTAAGKNDYDRSWYPEAFKKRVSTLDFRKTDAENWLFDPVSALYQQALRSGALEQYREAYLEHEFWIGHMAVVSGSLGVPAVAAVAATATTPAVAAKEGKAPIADYCIGGFNVGGVARPYGEDGAGCDGKYTYLTPMKLHLALTGDDSWTPEENGTPSALAKDRNTLIHTIAARSFDETWVRSCGLVKPYTNIGCAFTERNLGFAIQQLVAAYELTGDAAILANLRIAVDNIHGMMTNNPDGSGNNGYLSHSWAGHEGWYPAYIGTTTGEFADASTITVTNLLGDDWKHVSAMALITGRARNTRAKLNALPVPSPDGASLTLHLETPVTMRKGETVAVLTNTEPAGWVYAMAADRVFSPWMQSILADGLWQLYNLTGDTALQAKLAEILLGFGRAVTAYGIDGQGLDGKIKSQIESAFGVRVVSGSTSGARGIVPYTRYVANVHMAGPHATKEYIDFMSYDGAYADQHSLEALFQIAVALRFETDPAKKAAMAAVAEELADWVDGGNMSKTIQKSHPPRYFNWTNKPDAWGTYEATLQLIE